MRPATIGKTAAAVLLGLGITAVAAAGDDGDALKLTIGDSAPPIDIAHWLKGVEVDRRTGFTPMTEFEKGKVYVLEFWATWCGPCKAGMPHLSKLQKKFKDYGVTVIGVSDEPLPTVVNFLFDTWKEDGKTQNERTQYTLCTDPDESVKNDYFRAAGRTGIPSAFIVGKDSRIEWIGHPMLMDEPLEAVVFGTWDRDTFKTKWETDARRQAKFNQAYKKKDWDAIIALLDEQIAAEPENLGAMMQKFNLLLFNKKDAPAAFAFANAHLESAWDDAGVLNGLAWTIASDQRLDQRDFVLALKAATRAKELTKGQDAAILDTLARVYFEKGDVKSAIKWQREAVEYAGDDNLGGQIRKVLEKYEKAGN